SAMRIRGLRGATRVARDDSESIRAATRQLLAEMLLRNSLRQDAIVSAFFTVTPRFPCRARWTVWYGYCFTPSFPRTLQCGTCTSTEQRNYAPICDGGAAGRVLTGWTVRQQSRNPMRASIFAASITFAVLATPVVIPAQTPPDGA